MTQFVIKVKGMNKLQDAVRKAPKDVFDGLSNAIKTSLNLIRPIMKDEAPRGATGMLRRNIKVNHTGLKGEVGPSLNITPYAIYVHEGTRPYTIRPTTKKALFWAGAKHPVRVVHHPGIKANPFVEKTFNRIKPVVEKVFAKEIDKIISKFHS